MKNKILPSVTLCSICILVAAALASINLWTGPKIKEYNDAKANAALTEVMPGAEDFVDVALKSGIPESITLIKKSSDGGYVFRAVTTGYKGEITVMIGINSLGLITGTKCTANKETPNRAEPVFEVTDGDGWYVGMDGASIEEFILAGSTFTSKAYSKAVKDAFVAFNILVYGSADENCNIALGTEGVKFEKWFKTENVTADEVYFAEDLGVVALIGGTYVGVKDGAVVTNGVTESESHAALEAYNAYINEKLTLINLDGEYEEIEAVYKTTGGNFLFMLNAKGWGVDGDPDFASGEYIKIKLVIDNDGKILSIATIYQNEENGAECEGSDFYEGFVGAALDGVDGAGSVTGATVTTNGYKRAIKTAFGVYEKLMGGNG